jgi:P4 family phage/plasmid primase-like protien
VINPAFSYIQLTPLGKVPARDWREDARRTPSEVREWVAQGYNIGVRTDRSSGCWVLDVDIDVHTGQPTEEWAALLAEFGDLPATYTVRTPSGGIHYYFRFPEGIDVRNDQGKVIAPGVDIRGIGGYVVAPGMRATYDKHGVHFDGTYDVIDDSAIAHAPEWIVECFRAREAEKVERAERRIADGAPQPKAETIEDEWDNLAKAELNNLFAMVDQLVRLPEGESMDIFGEQRGWERGAGFFTLACKAIEVARWPHTSVTVDQVHEVWRTRVPGKYATHDWSNALEYAGPTWEFGERRRNPIDIFEGVRTLGEGSAPAEGAAAGTDWTPLDVDDQPIGWAVPHVFAMKDDDRPGFPTGPFLVEAARKLIDRIGPMAVDPAGSFWTYDRGVYKYAPMVVQKRLYHMLGDRYSVTILANVKSAVQATAPLLDLTQAPNPGVMNFINGSLEWRRGDDLVPHSPANLTTTQFPYAYDPTATCPKFDHWLATMLDPDQINLAWQILGYMMLSGNPLQVAFILYGKGSNGKSTFAHVVEHLLGDPNISAASLEDLNERFGTSDLIGKIANIVGDIDPEYQMKTATIKQVTGGDFMRFERKGRDAFRAALWATNLFSANQIPGSSDRSEGYAERWVPLHFKHKASERRIEGFSEEGLWSEIPGIAAKAIATLRTMNLHMGSNRNAAFDLASESGQEAMEEFREASNSWYDWIKNHTVASETTVMKPKELWQEFRTATGVRSGGTNCPRGFKEILDETYGESRMMRGLYMGMQRNVRGYRVALADDDEGTPSVGALDSLVQMSDTSH